MPDPIDYPADPLNLLAVELEPTPDDPEREVNFKDTLHRAVDAIEGGAKPDEVAAALAAALTDDEWNSLRDTVREGWASETAPDRPVGALCLALAELGGRSFEPHFDGSEVARVVRERDEAREKLAEYGALLQDVGILVEAVADLGGNLPDEEWTTRTGANDAVARGLKVVLARGLARRALHMLAQADAPAPDLQARIAALVAAGASLQMMTAPFHADDPRAAAFCDLIPDNDEFTPFENMIVATNEDTNRADGWAWALCWKRLDTLDARKSELWPDDHAEPEDDDETEED